LFEFFKAPISTLQDFFILGGKACANIFRTPHYWDDVLTQMDRIGVGSLPIVALTGGFSGAVMALQMSKALDTYGASSQVGQIVSITLVAQLGPVLTSLLVAGRNASGIASELGSMKVTEQIDAMRALGTDPVQKLVTPRMLAMTIMLPFLTVIADFVGMLGGWMVALGLIGTTTAMYWTGVHEILEYEDVLQGLIKPLFNGFVISLVGCFYGMTTTGGTQGVGRSTTQAVVVSSVWVFVINLFLTQIFVNL
jgi:phospholipid/cholesterol/gamma-HCH transport system permease protein